MDEVRERVGVRVRVREVSFYIPLHPRHSDMKYMPGRVSTNS